MMKMSELIERLLLQHTHSEGFVGRLSFELSIRDELGVESLSLVSVLVDLGAELGIDISEAGVELARIQTVGDLIGLGDLLAARNADSGLAPQPPADVGLRPSSSSNLPTTNDKRGQESP